jgi:hypothetical protein
MGRTYVVKRRTIPHHGRATFFNAHLRCRIEPGTCVMARSVPRLKTFIFNYTLINGFRCVSKHMFYWFKLTQHLTERESNYSSTSLIDSK